MSIHYLFDCDGTLCESRRPMDKDFASKFTDWSESHLFSLVSGSDIAKIIEQVPEGILVHADKVFACAGNAIYEWARPITNDPLQSYNDFQCTLIEEHPFIPCSQLTDYLEHELKYCNWPGKKFNTHFEKRIGLLNFSILGRDADQTSRDDYEKWDKEDGERIRIVNGINQRFPSLHASAGGQISIDICEKGKDKSQVLDYINLKENTVIFYGDKTLEGGNDYPLAQAIKDRQCGEVVHVKCWQDVELSLSLTIRKTIGKKKNKEVGFPFAKE